MLCTMKLLPLLFNIKLSEKLCCIDLLKCSLSINVNIAATIFLRIQSNLSQGSEAILREYINLIEPLLFAIRFCVFFRICTTYSWMVADGRGIVSAALKWAWFGSNSLCFVLTKFDMSHSFLLRRAYNSDILVGIHTPYSTTYSFTRSLYTHVNIFGFCAYIHTSLRACLTCMVCQSVSLGCLWCSSMQCVPT